MLYSIFGLNQRLAIEYGLDLRDMLLLSYVIGGLAIPGTECKMLEDDGRPFIWISRSKILEDLPILDLSIDRIGKVLHQLVESGFLEERSISNDDLKGSRCYYRTTEKTYLLWSDSLPKVKKQKKRFKPAENIEELKITLPRGVKNNSPIPHSNKQIDNTLNSKEANKQISQRAKKQSLYDKCIEQIEAFTEDERLREALIQYLKGLLEICRAEKRPIYTNMFIGKLNRLKTFPEKDWLEIVELATSNGWKNFYSLQNNSTRSNLRQNTFNDKATSEHYTNEELKEIDRLNEERRKRGLRTEF